MVRHRSPRSDPKDLEKFGPRLEIAVGPPVIRNPKKAGLQSSLDTGWQQSSRMPALIDTGAGRTVLTPQAIQKLDLPLIDYTTISRAGGMDRAAVYAASISFPREELAPIELIQVLCCELPGGIFQCLIGRDILSRWLFTYDGKNGVWSIDEGHVAAWVEPPEGLT